MSFSSLTSIAVFILAFAGAGWGQDRAQVMSAPHPLITKALDESQLTTLKGNTHHLARKEFDLGTAPATLPMQRMLLVLKRSPEQQVALRKLLDDQQDKHSPSYHKWVTPEEFGKRFGPSDADMQTIAGWLQAHGFQVGTTKGRTVLEFSGSASQVQETFHTAIHKYIVNGEQHWANASDPQIPAALLPAAAGVATLHNFVSRPQSHLKQEPVLARVVPGARPEITFTQNGQQIHALAPQDYAVIYNITSPAYNPWTGAGVTIGVVGRNDLYGGGQDVLNFLGVVGSGMNSFGGGFVNVIVNGPDPGNAGGGEEAEATLDTTWSSAIAPNAMVDFVVSGTTNNTDGVDLSELYIVENNLTDIMTESFGSCEYFATDAKLQEIRALAEQAAAQGITYFVSSGDNGAEGCDDPSNPPAQYPVSVSATAATAFNVAVGGTMFNENGTPSKYWASTAPPAETALSYIPEDVWNQSSASNGLWAGSGGASAGNIGNNQISPVGTTAGVAKPSWQSGAGLNIPQDGVRDVPDVSLTSAGHDPYLLCLDGSCIPDGQGFIHVYFISGTSAAAPSMAGIMALVVQSAGRQGQANYVLYSLAASQAAQGIYPSQCNGSSSSTLSASTCIFNDVTVGNNAVPGELGSDYKAGPGYDLATGLGSVNVANLITNWSTVTFSPTTTQLMLKGGTTDITITHGDPVAVSAAVTPNSGTGTPTGDVTLYYGSIGVEGSTMDLFHLSNGTVSGSTSSLPGRSIITYSVWAHYSGDGTYAPSDSNRINVVVNPEPSTTTLSLSGSDLSGRPLTGTFPFGSLVFVRADVAGNSGKGIATGSVTFTDSFGPIPSANPQVNPPVQVVNNPPLNSQGNTSIGDGIVSFDAGNHSISASYGGDPSFSASSSTAPVTFTVQPGFALVSGPTNVRISAAGTSGTSTVGIIASTGFTAAVTLSCSGLPVEATCSSTSITGQGPTTVASTALTISTAAAHLVMQQSSERRYYAVLLGGGLPLMGIFLIAAPKQRRGALVLGMMLLGLVAVFPSCGGGGGATPVAHQQDPGTPAGSYVVTVTATAGSLKQQGSFALVIR
ncbi:MAG: protease pro-enzyme activation domain-containing protein [Candidatus Sulfotelmatobacter sp.]